MPFNQKPQKFNAKINTVDGWILAIKQLQSGGEFYISFLYI